MALSTQYEQEYQRAERAYIQGRYKEAADIADRLIQKSPTDPSILLLRGHIYCCFEQYDRARAEYERVLSVTAEEDFLGYARKGIEDAQRWQEQQGQHSDNVTELSPPSPDRGDLASQPFSGPLSGSLSSLEEWDEGSEVTLPAADALDPFATTLSEDGMAAASEKLPSDWSVEDPFVLDSNEANQQTSTSEQGFVVPTEEDSQPTGIPFDTGENTTGEVTGFAREDDGEGEADSELSDAATLLMMPGEGAGDAFEASVELSDANLTGTHDAVENGFQSVDVEQTTWSESAAAQDLADFRLPQLDMNELESRSFATADNEVDDLGTMSSGTQVPSPPASKATSTSGWTADTSAEFLSGSEEPTVRSRGILAALHDAPLGRKQLYVAGAAGIVAAGAVLLAGTLLPISGGGSSSPPARFKISAAMGAIAGITSFGTVWLIGGAVARHTKRATADLQAQFYAVQQGNLNAKATVYSGDELGQLSAGFNQMTRAIATVTNEAQRKAQEQEQAKEDLQRQVIRLLDDVEGAARGDLTVQAEVSADVLGAVADAFNLTIRNLRTIVQQVKEAARQVNKCSAESESFAHSLSEDALRQAEELAVTLNSVQMMTDSIQRVAENAQEAEDVAQQASETALRGGEAVDSAVAGILQIRETVAQTARKVKRLAESSQEISKIVSAISQIASRTNNLALNASIEAARAGEAGRGFAVIADEVRQLADRSAKSLREIEKIVLQIQSETSSVMVAMEEGTQQVIEGTNRAEQAKQSLEDIIQVSKRIDTLVRSITADTVEQTETSRSVAQVMQSVEMTAQGTSQESQQVSGALQNLVSLAGDLLASVERFRVDPGEAS
ncbi:methyl-accepting chemotaxis protein [Rubidibacter lacunae KORDI 51-2]|uniref:Methyl-accepting chemotaxis protein n=1 Tax=Rubidibacter lacunae KORDI 51-2 TaxID=582515 RepID=U5DMM9_9CHRO|nr:HAMP domain-containing methyl-accepting chemotaxis protein [Rubidibacter lacunae]ERN40960.1 methyl-accepting chemotaxis protein [Rubidibacter lacunae KORDI 51-2]